MKIKCIALDLDRTTLDGQGRLSEGNRAALLQAMANGIHVIVASGRAFATLPEDIITLPGIEYAVTGNGAAMYHVPSGKCLHRYMLKEEDIMAVMDATAERSFRAEIAVPGRVAVCRCAVSGRRTAIQGQDTAEAAGMAVKRPITYEAFIDGAAYAGREYVENPAAFGAAPQAVEYVRSTRHLVEDIRAFIMEHRKEMDSMDIIVKDGEDKKVIWRIVEECTEEVYITSSIPQLIEISHKDAGKHSGVRYFMERLGLQRDEVAAFGDADNDVDMLLFAGCGIAMGNASEKCRAAADYITKNHMEDGVAYGLREILHVIRK